ncbi:helix-turn-helix transcriptional regulator [Caballeronia sp. LZ029]|uniref:AraC family transcriptional regulator n=1 Tax=Caballeronia sp. LZ029 TaxID=3038564 RepID=UPI00285DEDE4|nr:helix-turn-helix transcriptional regulator [Caballeronia sp. LZ029]MDR5745802.1 helix-turn-helix transcriptional regulator [Caballeronia sp. LZ029]
MAGERRKADIYLESTGVVVTTSTFKPGDVFARHTHDEGQFAYAVSGGISMFTDKGNWIVPAQRAIWVPANIGHEMHMHGAVTMLNTFIEHKSAKLAALPPSCQVYGVSALLRHLFDAMLALPSGMSARRARLESILLDELSGMPRLPLSVPLPQDPRLSKACRRMLDAPTQSISIDAMAKMANMSRRAFTRLFREATGVSFVVWRQQVCVLEALSRLSQGESVKDISADLGYSSTSAFTATFKLLLGDTPVRYLARYRELTLSSEAGNWA